jgi:hypothetical protein
MNVGDRVTPAQLERAGFTRCPMALKSFSYWFHPVEMYWIRVADGVVTNRFTE